MGLAEYKRKRDFAKTAEPKGGKPLPKKIKGASRFVIQKHDASRLHYDFRLEMDGVLKSWAVPKGLPWAQGEKHLAVEVEDHPVEYAAFEGVIPEGQYGGGTVMLWDRGNYHVYGEEPLKSWREGKLHLVLDGEKAKGEWTLVRIRGRDGEKNQWLILKTGGSSKPLAKRRDDESVTTGRTMRQIAEQRDAEWQSNREESGDARSILKSRIKDALRKHRAAAPGRELSKSAAANDLDQAIIDLPTAKPRFIEPMKPKLLDQPPSAGDWLYELKFDGIRAIAVKEGGKVNLISRNEHELRGRFPEIVGALKNLAIDECVIDGEVVALDEEGRSSFQLLQALEMEGRKSPVRFYVFDLLQLNGKSLLKFPLVRRKELLAQISAAALEPIRYSGEIAGDAKALLAEVKKRGLEGLIGKLRDSAYEPGRRSGTWIKLKCVSEQEFIIAGYTPPSGSRKYFGAILVGYYEGGSLKFAGKVGTGFNAKSLAMLHKKFQAEAHDDCPFVDLPSKEGGQWAQGITPSVMKKMHWVNPKLVAQIKFSEWTRDGKLRQPVFLGLREDKDAREVTRES